MRYRQKGFTWGMVCMLVVMTILGGCSASPKEEAGAAAKGAEAAKEGKTEPMVIKWLGFYPPEKDNSPVQQYLEKKFNVKIENMRIDRSSWKEQLNIKLATGEVPDVFFLWGADEIATYSQQGVLTELPVEEMKKNMPKYAKSVDDKDTLLWEYGKSNGKSYAIPLYWEPGQYPFQPIYNGNWLKANGYQEPPKTLDELEDVLTKFRNNDPDGNGKKDTYGMSVRGKDNLNVAFNSVFGAYGIHWIQWVEGKDGKLSFGMVTEQARQAYKTIAKWYKNGLIDPEFITTDDQKLKRDLFNGRIGMADSAGNWIESHPQIGAWGTGFKNGNPGNELMVGKSLKGPGEESGLHAWGVKNNYIGMGSTVSKDEAKKRKIYEILEALAIDKETYLMASNGVEGEHYEMKDGVPIMKAGFASDIEKAKFGGGPFYGMFSNGKTSYMSNLLFSKEQIAYRDKVSAGIKPLISKKPFAVPSEKDFPDLGKLQNEYFIKFVTGEVDLDGGFDKFVETWKKAGGGKITEEVNQRYQEFKKK